MSAARRHAHRSHSLPAPSQPHLLQETDELVAEWQPKPLVPAPLARAGAAAAEAPGRAPVVEGRVGRLVSADGMANVLNFASLNFWGDTHTKQAQVRRTSTAWYCTAELMKLWALAVLATSASIKPCA